MTIERLRPAFTFTEDRLRELQTVVPEAFVDGKVNWEMLREALGEFLEDETQEHFGLMWPGKRAARRLAALPPQGTLVPAPSKGVNEATTRNIFIEGENLEVLKLLQKSYAGRVKLIYIDPPYNTGNDFVYPDDYSEPLDAYLRRTGQMNEEGQRLTTNTRVSGRFHSNWLSMMYPRLLLARRLLRDDGLIFVSIDDNELHNLHLVMNEVFGEENFVSNIAWEKRFTRSNNAQMFYSLKDSILVYRGNGVTFLREPRTAKSDSIYSNPDDDPRGAWTSASYVNPATKEQRPNLVYTIVNPFTGEEINHPTHAWKFEKAEHLRHVKDNRLWWGKSGDAKFPRLKIFLSESEGLVPVDLWDYESAGTTDEGGLEVKKLFGEGIFDNPKPTKLIRRILQIINGKTGISEGDIVLDFFAGSCTTAHATLLQNRDTGGNRRFIMVQLPEPTPLNSISEKAGYATIAEIGKERIRRAIAEMQTASSAQTDLDFQEDLGFRTFVLERSRFKPWKPVEPTDPKQLDYLHTQYVSPLEDGWEQIDLLTEILLLEGFPLDSSLAQLESVTENSIRRVHHPDVRHELYICLDATIATTTIDTLKAGAIVRGDNIFICLDSALTDEVKVVLDDRLRLKVI